MPFRSHSGHSNASQQAWKGRTMTPTTIPNWNLSPWRVLLWGLPAALLIAPAVAMRFTAEVQWAPFDFVFAAVLLFGATGMADLAIRKGGSLAYRLGAGLAVLASFLLIWVNAAVGMIGNEDNPANLLFIGIIAVAAAGSVIARFRARGMARAMLAAFILTAAIAAAAPALGWGADEPRGTAGLMMLIGGFAAMWGLSAAFFAKAART
jgi:hypothetical protein